MPINAFGGGPGSGKTYGVVEHVILPAIAKGRFVITNIEGLNDDLIYEYVAKEFYKGKIICIGHIRRCARDDPDREDFFPGADALDKPMACPLPDMVTVNGGDLVVIDEATRHWSGSDKVKRAHAYFFREHRHFANVMGHTCDMVVIDPDLTMLARALKGKIELASVTHKPKEIGLDRYVVRLFRGVRTTGKPTSTQGPYRFDPKIYALYKSYSHTGAKEQAIDKRQNMFNNPRFWVFAVGMVLLLLGCMWLLWFVYHRQVAKNTGSAATVAAPAGASAAPGTSGASSAAPSSAAGSVSPTKATSLRVAGEVTFHGEHWIVVVDESGATRFENPAAFVGRGSLIVGNIEGQRVATWTGVQPKAPSIVGGAK